MASRPGLKAVLALAIAGLTTMMAGAGCTGPSVGRADDVVKVDLTGRTLAVLPARYLGLSFESNSTEGAGGFAVDGNLAALLENLGPGVLRFGGNSVDHSYDGPSQAALAALADLVRSTRWNVIFSVDLGQFSADQAGRVAAAAEQAFGARLTAIACGNEPDDFAGSVRSDNFTEADYFTQARACFDAVRAAVPTARIAGPDTAHLRWLGQYASAAKGTISLLTQHYYPLSDCGSGGTAAALLSRATAGAEARRDPRGGRCRPHRWRPAAHQRNQLSLLRRHPGSQRHVRRGAMGDRLLADQRRAGCQRIELSRIDDPALQRLLSAVSYPHQRVHRATRLLRAAVHPPGRYRPPAARRHRPGREPGRARGPGLGRKGPGCHRESDRPGQEHSPASRNQLRDRDGTAPDRPVTGSHQPDPPPGSNDPALRTLPPARRTTSPASRAPANCA